MESEFLGPVGWKVSFSLTEDAKKMLACPHCGTYPVEECISEKKMRWDRVWYAPWRRRPAYAAACKNCGQRIGWSWSVSIEQAIATIRKQVYSAMVDDLVSWMSGTEK